MYQAFAAQHTTTTSPTNPPSNMRVAIGGSGSLAKYFSDELPKAGHEVETLTMSHKPFFDDQEGVS